MMSRDMWDQKTDYKQIENDLFISPEADAIFWSETKKEPLLLHHTDSRNGPLH